MYTRWQQKQASEEGATTHYTDSETTNDEDHVKLKWKLKVEDKKKREKITKAAEERKEKKWPERC